MTRHGTYANYQAGCREACCRSAAAKYEAQRIKDTILGRPRRIPAFGIERRIHALVALGWTHREIARRVGIAESNLKRKRQWLSPRLATATIRVYEELSGTIGPSDAARRLAVKRQWYPPLAWDDIDDPNGKPKVSGAVSSEVDRILHGRGLIDSEITDQLGLTGRTVLRIRHRLSLPPNTTTNRPQSEWWGAA